ncbi:DNA topoisomerase III [Bacillus sp. 165]|uniref:DNA topoisomerase III n=1 Tax=Bacillus sp. 165 TaxID=1529117 RepID=UPI001ADC0704|nr:DNA topoisomerase III [Bacillus sp. 165]MBO9128172.1 DNA topoisomerase III [Bacillus sp. 165]
MKVIIAEKPDQAMKLAAPFTYKKKDGYLEVGASSFFPEGAYFTWAVGHICELLSPEEYNEGWKKWSVATLPMIPDKFQYKVTKSKAKQFYAIRDLLKKPEVKEIIHAGDAGREGELIVRTIVQTARISKPMKRLWISSLTEKAVKDGFSKLLEEKDTRQLYYEAYSRACADWLVGMNASRIYTILLKEKGISDVFSAGRVQTPTLALVVKREKEIGSFVSHPFWEVIAIFDMDGKRYEGKWHKENETRLDNADMAAKVAAFCQGKPARIEEAETERKEFQPPLLFNLSALQATANRIFKFPPKKTLDIAQALYTKGYLSYPRSDSTFVTRGEAEGFADILDKLSKQEVYKSYFPTPVTSIIHNKRYVNEKKVTDHYAIIPTEQVPNVTKLSGDEQKIYDLVVKRLIAAHYDPAIFDYTTITTLVDGRATFVSKGKQQIQEGWRKVVFHSNSKEEDDDVLLPPLVKGETGIVTDVSVKEGKTQPPKRYTEGQLITLMKTVGKVLEDGQLEKVLNKVEGLGTEATRAGIITMLKDRKYIEVTKNQVFATQKGMLLVDAIGEQILASPEMTARWEQRLGEIGEGKADAAAFMEQVKKLSATIIENAVSQSKNWDFSHVDTSQFVQEKREKKVSVPLGNCKKCNGQIVDKGTFYGCTNYNVTKCNFTLSKKVLGKTISQANIKKLLKSGKTNIIKGFKKGEKSFDAMVVWDEKEGKTKFEFAS